MYDFVIRIYLPVPVQERHRKRVRRSIRNYFRYLELLERRKLKKMLWKSFLLFCLGMILLTVSMILKENMGGRSTGVGHELVIEGLTVAAWVSLWSVFTGLIFQLAEIIGNKLIFRRIAGSEVVFKTRNFPRAVHPGEAGETSRADPGTLGKAA